MTTDHEQELMNILKEEILKELASQHSVTPEEMQKTIDAPIIQAIIDAHNQSGSNDDQT